MSTSNSVKDQPCKIRQGVFETNSSSTHSIIFPDNDNHQVNLYNVIANGTDKFKLSEGDDYPISTDYQITQDGNFIFKNEEFGWDETDYNQADIKAMYVWLYIADWVRNDDQCKLTFSKMLGECLQQQTSCTGFIIHQLSHDYEYKIMLDSVKTEKDKCYFWNPEDLSLMRQHRDWSGDTPKEEILEFGYIDHQSVEDRNLDFLFEDPKLLFRFIFDSNVILRTDNDNH